MTTGQTASPRPAGDVAASDEGAQKAGLPGSGQAKPANAPVPLRPVAPAPTAQPAPAAPAPTKPAPAKPAPAKPAPAKPAPAKPAPIKPTPAAPAPAATVPLPDTIERAAKPRRRRARSSAGVLLFLFMVVVPTILVAWYYAAVASDQYRSEMRFAVRGTNGTSPLATLGLSAIPGATTQSADAYIVTDYLQSLQVLKDLKEERGIDVRQFFARDEIDTLFRLPADMPFEEFLWYWNFMTDADFNSTTSITTFRVDAFSAEDAETISSAVLAAAAKLVNDLSDDAQAQLIETAEEEVLRTQDRLTQARQRVTAFQNLEQSVDPTEQAKGDLELILGLQKELIELRARREALLSTVSSTSPSVRVLDRQIQAVTSQIDAQRQAIGTGGAEPGNGDNRSSQINRFSSLMLDAEFAQKAYTTALSSLEASQAEARTQERYFAIVVEPTRPEVALYPERIANTLIAFAAFLVLWLIVYLVWQSVRDHAA